MEHFVTVFDSGFLPQGLALQESLERHAQPYVLWVLCVDDEAFFCMRELGLPGVRLLRLRDWETPELLEAKLTRSAREYCWTLTPFAPRFVFDQDPYIERVTYIDADLWFRSSPEPIFLELEEAGKDVLITDHCYAPEHDLSSKSGRYCVQFVTFTRARGEGVRRWWADRCIEWCYARFDNGRFGDQKYLDELPEQFPDQVHVLRRTELVRAPWNEVRAPYEAAVFFHFHGLRLLPNDKVHLGGYPISPSLLNGVYYPYMAALRRAMELVQRTGRRTPVQQPHNMMLRLKSLLFSQGSRQRFLVVPVPSQSASTLSS
jgi:hypothetical protein